MSILLKSLPSQERPRERFLRYGKEGISNVELLAILLGSGTKNRSVMQLAADVLAHFGSLKELSSASFSELKQIKGVGSAKALQLQAAFALLSRIEEGAERLILDQPDRIYAIVRKDLEKAQTEMLMLVLRDVKRYQIHKEVISQGTLTELLVHPREVFHVAIRHRAHSIIIAHNHPSGDPSPSGRDLEMTQVLLEASHVVGIELIDHLIIGKNSFVSLYKKGFFKRSGY